MRVCCFKVFRAGGNRLNILNSLLLACLVAIHGFRRSFTLQVPLQDPVLALEYSLTTSGDPPPIPLHLPSSNLNRYAAYNACKYWHFSSLHSLTIMLER
jgi:hypothetical protein